MGLPAQRLHEKQIEIRRSAYFSSKNQDEGSGTIPDRNFRETGHPRMYLR
jgi:hypothetical protein